MRALTLDLVKHSGPILLLVAGLFEVVVVDQEARAEQDGLHPHVKVNGKADAKDVGVGEGFLEQARPLLADLSNLQGGRKHFKQDDCSSGPIAAKRLCDQMI